jgi:FMN phosphatase YigB (HAD superfamily)
MAAYKAVFLDVGGIILQIDWNRPFQFAGVNDPRRRHELIAAFEGWKVFQLFEKGKISSEQFFAEFNSFLGMNRSPKFWQEAWEQILIGPLLDVEMIFDALSGKIPICAVSNTNIVHYDYQIRHFPLMARFDRYFTSFELGERKPSTEFFLKAAKAVGFEPNEILFVDDMLENVAAARRIGFHSAQTVNSPRETLDFLQANL